MSLHTGLEDVKVGNRESLLNTLRNLSDFDCDFNGENGEGYLWDSAEGFESNMEYLINKVKDIKGDENCVNAFFEEWMGNDSYYGEWNVSVLTDMKKRITVISFSVICGD